MIVMPRQLMIGAVAYDPKVVPVWEGIKAYFVGAPVAIANKDRYRADSVLDAARCRVCS